MTLPLSRRTVLAGLGAATLAAAAEAAAVEPGEALWRAACDATETAWADECAALEGTLEDGAEAVHDRYYEDARLYWRQRRCDSLRELAGACNDLDREDAMDKILADQRQISFYEYEQLCWRHLAKQRGLAALTARVDAAEAAEDALGAWLLDPATGSSKALRRAVRDRIAPLEAFGRHPSHQWLSSIAHAGRAAPGEAFTAAVFVRRMEQLGYVIGCDGGDHRPHDRDHVESLAQLRRRGRLIACALSKPDFIDAVDSFVASERPDRGIWWPGPW